VPKDDYFSLTVDRKARCGPVRREPAGIAAGPQPFEQEGDGKVGSTQVGYAQIGLDLDGRLLVGSVKGLAIRDHGLWSL
jgi:hypothetical protein